MLSKLKRTVDAGAMSLLRRLPGGAREAVRLSEYARDCVAPLPAAVRDTEQWVPASRIGANGIDLREVQQLGKLERWKASKYQQLFGELRHAVAINTQRLGQSALANGWYNTPDAEIYAAMIYDWQPRRIVEIGAGFSTRIARASIRHAGLATRVTVVDPQPRADIHDIADEVITKPAEASFLHARDWAAGDLLFIDSSHICRTRGDIPYIYCELIPLLPPGVLVHVHDIYLPFDYPNHLDSRWYTEQYVLHALLSHSPRYKTVITSHWLSRTHPDRMREAFGADVARDARHYGGCYWFMVE